MSSKKCKQKIGQASDWFKNSKGSHERRLNLNLRLDDNYNYSVCSSSSSPSSRPCSPYWSPATKSLAGIPFAWEDRPGVSKHNKSPTPDGCFGDQPPPTQSKFSVVEAFKVESQPHRRPEKKAGEVNPFVSAFVECNTKKPAPAVSLAKNDGRGRGKEGYGLAYSCITSCTVTADALIAIPGRARQPSRQNNNNKNTNNDWKIQKSYPGYKFGKE